MTVNKLRYLKRTNLEHSQNIVKNYYHDLINSYGVDVTYFRKELDFYKSPVSGIQHSDYTYGEDTTSNYWLSAPMVVYMEMQGDSFLLSKFGISTNGDATMYFTIEDFNEQFRDLIGQTSEDMFTTIVTGEVINFECTLDGDVFNEEVEGSVSQDITTTSGAVSGIFTSSIEHDLVAVNDMIKLPDYYNYGERISNGELSGIYDGTVDENGNGFLSGEVSGIVEYHIQDAEMSAPGWQLAPQVRDFFRLHFGTATDKAEDYEISRVHDRNLQVDGLNPLMGTYIWRCDVVRRENSHETNIVGADKEPDSPDYTLTTGIQDDISNEIFDYDTQTIDETDNETNADSVYGGYY